MENVLVDRSAGGHEFRRRAGAGGGGCRRLAVTSPATLPRGAGGYTSFPYHSSAPPFHPPYAAYHHNLCSSHSLPLLPSHHHPALLPRPPLAAAVARHATFPYRPVTLPPPPLPPAGASATAKVKQATVTGMTVPAAAVRKVGEYKRKKPRAPRSTEESPAAQRRKPLQRAAPLPAATAVTEALDDLEREVTRGFVEDLLHALAPPPSSLPLPTFSLVRAAAGAKAAAPSCAV